MPRPKTKDDLLKISQVSYRDLVSLATLVADEMGTTTFPFEHRDRNLRDVLGHLNEWQNLFAKWYRVGMKGGMPSMPAEGFTWRETKELNAQLWENLQGQELGDVSCALERSHRRLRRWIRGHTEAELFDRRQYAWTGTTHLASYFASATSSHYDWAIRLLRRARKEGLR